MTDLKMGDRLDWELSAEAQAQIDDVRCISREGEPTDLTEPHTALVEKIAGMRTRAELEQMGFPALPSDGLQAVLDEVIAEARALRAMKEEGR